MNRQERFELAKAILNTVTDVPCSLSELASKVGRTRNQIHYLIQQLREKGMVKVETGNYGGVVKKGTHGDEALLKALGYWSPEVKQVVQCNSCENFKTRIRKPTTTMPYYTDEKNRRWVGKCCPDCVGLGEHRTNVQPEPALLTKRKCRECSEFLPPSRYFNCEKCVPKYDDVEDDLIYHSTEKHWSNIEGEDYLLDPQVTPLEHKPWQNNDAIFGKKKYERN